ncbi:MAG TPA: ScyD/ScyE family protein [Chryseolinea sp.]|nr:ScyD/ScyE family protein [Chryseolinea sp.]
MLKQSNPRFTTTRNVFRVTTLFALTVGFIGMLGGCDNADPDMGCQQQIKITSARLVTGLEELQGSTIGPSSDLYVTAPLTGSIWRVDRKSGKTSLFASGLPARDPDPYFQGSGVVDVAFLGGTAYALVTGVAPDLGGSDIVGIYRMDGPNAFSVVADLGAWSEAHPPETDIFIATGFQYAMQTYKDGFIVTDGHHNRVLQVGLDGEITELVAFGNVVPIGLALRGNTVYIGQAGPIPHVPEESKVFSFTMQSLTPTQLASGVGLEDIGLLADLEFGPGGELYGILQGFWDGPFEGAPAEPNTGALVSVNTDGSFTILMDGLNQPTSLEIIGTTAYVVSLAGEVWTIETSRVRPCEVWREQ